MVGLAGWLSKGKNNTGGGGGASGPCIVVKPYAGSFTATFLKRTDGSEHRLQIFPDPHAAHRCAKLLNAAMSEARL